MFRSVRLLHPIGLIQTIESKQMNDYNMTYHSFELKESFRLTQNEKRFLLSPACLQTICFASTIQNCSREKKIVIGRRIYVNYIRTIVTFCRFTLIHDNDDDDYENENKSLYQYDDANSS